MPCLPNESSIWSQLIIHVFRFHPDRLLFSHTRGAEVRVGTVPLNERGLKPNTYVVQRAVWCYCGEPAAASSGHKHPGIHQSWKLVRPAADG